jgi:hypothetical protein
MTTADTLAPSLPAEAAPPPIRRGRLVLLLGVVAAPRATFAYLRDRGGGTWLWPLLAAVALTVAAKIVAAPIERARAEAARAVLEAQLAGQLGEGNFTAGVPAGGVPLGIPLMAAPGGAASSPLLDYGLPALGVVWDWALRGGALLGLAWLLGGRPGAGAMFRITGWSLVPDIARLLVALGVMLAAGRVPARGLAGFDAAGGAPVATRIDGSTAEGDGQGEPGDVITFQAGTGGAVVGPGGALGAGAMFAVFLRDSFLSALDVYTFWMLALLAIGVAVTARLGWLKAGLATLLYWGLSLVLTALPPLVSFWVLSLAGPGLR